MDQRHMVKRRWAILLLIGALLLVSPAVQAAPLAQATATYTPVPTRTPAAATQVVTLLTSGGSTMAIDRSVSYGDVYIVSALAVLGAGLATAFAYAWVKSHIKVSE